MLDLSSVSLGKKPFVPHRHDMHLRAYLDRKKAEVDIANAPAAINWYEMPMPNGNLPEWDSDPLGNIDYGDCFYAAVAHLQMLQSKLAGTPLVITTEQVLREYQVGTGFDPATGYNDGGTIPREGMYQWRTLGLFGDRLDASLLVNKDDELEVKWALWNSVGLLGGFQLPECARTQVDASGNPDWFIPVGGWPKGDYPGKWGGHMIALHGFGNSWGLRTNMTSGWFSACCDELHMPVSKRMQLRNGRVPCGLEYGQVLADARARGAQ